MAASVDRERLLDRFVYPAIAEAARLLDEGIASAKDIDLAMRAGAGFAVGPLEQADTIGLDTVLLKLRELQSAHGDTYAPGKTLEDLVAGGHLGKRTGRGFLEY